MIKKYNQYIKETINLDIDPYGEEDWDEVNLPPLLQLVRRTGKPYEQITVLECFYEQLTNLDGIENLTNLKSLNCSYNQLTSLEGIENLINLKYLDCHNNRLTSLNDIENLTNLEILCIGYNQLTSLDGIENLINLKRLYCWNNQFSEEYRKYIEDYCRRRNIKLHDHHLYRNLWQ